MPKTANLYVRIEPEVKEQAEKILDEMGISASSAITMYYKQIILQRGLPFEIRLPDSKPTVVGGMTREELDIELKKGIDSMKAGDTYTADEVDAELAEEFGV